MMLHATARAARDRRDDILDALDAAGVPYHIHGQQVRPHNVRPWTEEEAARLRAAVTGLPSGGLHSVDGQIVPGQIATTQRLLTPEARACFTDQTYPAEPTQGFRMYCASPPVKELAS